MRKSSILLIIVASVLWGTSGIFANLLGPQGFSPLQMTAMRGTVSAIVMSIYLFVTNKDVFRVSLSQLFWYACGGITMFLSAFFYYESIRASSVSVAVMLMYTAPVFVMAYSVAFLGEKLTKAKFLSIMCVLIGCALISGIFGSAKFNAWGAAAGLISGISYSAYNIIAKVQMSKKGNPLSASVYCYIFMALVSLCAADVPQVFVIANQNPVMLYPLIIGIGIFTVTLPYSLYTMALKYVPVGTASALGIIEPMTATLFGTVFFGDTLSFSAVCGIVLIMGAVIILSVSKE